MTELNPVRGRFNAWFFRILDRYMDHHLGSAKRALFADLPTTVVELGSGVGANLHYFRRGTKLIAFEPNRYMHARLSTRAASAGIDLSIHEAGAERLDLPDGSVDAVVCSLVLCTVRDVEAVLREVKRVLRPGGRFVCLEHVGARTGSLLHVLQRAIARPWRWLFEGCHTHRDLERTIRAAGFTDVHVDHAAGPLLFLPVRPQIRVHAVR